MVKYEDVKDVIDMKYAGKTPAEIHAAFRERGYDNADTMAIFREAIELLDTEVETTNAEIALLKRSATEE
jgi:hypothetical protein